MVPLISFSHDDVKQRFLRLEGIFGVTQWEKAREIYGASLDQM